MVSHSDGFIVYTDLDGQKHLKMNYKKGVIAVTVERNKKWGLRFRT